ncbi:MAG: traA [Bradyrhizobium sp.]|nr:traA [Bradyrhizobium sp.]
MAVSRSPRIASSARDWQRDATRHLATGRTGEALRDHGERGTIHPAATREDTRGELVERWDRQRQAGPTDTRIILTHTNDEVRALNEAARGRMRDGGALGGDLQVSVERGERQFAPGDRVIFLGNERGLGVKNGVPVSISRRGPGSFRPMPMAARASCIATVASPVLLWN